MSQQTSKKIEESNVSIISNGTIISGVIETENFLRIEGKIDGDILSSNKVLVAQSAVINGNFAAGIVIIQGKVKGNINANENCTVAAGGILEGNIAAKTVNIELNSHFTGFCKTGIQSNGDIDLHENK